jgi:hypothetical protein
MDLMTGRQRVVLLWTISTEGIPGPATLERR